LARKREGREGGIRGRREQKEEGARASECACGALRVGRAVKGGSGVGRAVADSGV